MIQSSFLKTLIEQNGLFYQRIFFVTILVVLCLPPVLYQAPGFGLDPSWMIALQLANHENLTFGNDFIFTYGPLGFLATRSPILISKYLYVLFDLYLLAALAFAINYIVGKYNHFTGFIVMIITIVMIHDFRDHDISAVLSFLMLFFLYRHYETRNVFHLAHAIWLATLIVFIKLNFGLISLFILVLYLVLLIITKFYSLKFIGYLLGIYVVLFTGFCFLLNVNFFSYFVASLHIIGSYNDAMYYPIVNPLGNAIFISALFIVAIIICYFLYHIRAVFQNYFVLFFSAVFALLTYVTFKQGFVRLHTEGFFQNLTLFLGILCIVFKDKMKTNAHLLFLLVLFVSFINVSKVNHLFSHELFLDKLRSLRTYVQQFRSFDKTDFRGPNKVPDLVKNQIEGSVDIIPHDISYAYASDLKYNPRPVMQSYSAYDQYLDNLNAEKLSSSTAPENLLITYAAIDNRYPLFDETTTKLAILKNYEIVNTTWEHLLLKKSNQPIASSSTIRKQQGELDKSIKLPVTNNILIMRADVHYSLLGKLRRLLFQPPQLFVSLITENGKVYEYRAITTLLAGGVIINKFINKQNNNDFEVFLASQGQSNTKIASVKFFSDAPWGFNDTFTFSLEELKIDSKGRTSPLYEPQEVQNQVVTNNIKFNLELIQNEANFAVINGWAFPDTQEINNPKVSIVLKSKAGSFVFPTQPIERADVSDYFKHKHKNFGFKAFILDKYLPPGTYDIAVGIADGDNRYFQFAGKTLTFDSLKLPPIARENWVEGKIKINIDSFTDTQEGVNVKGWAFSEDQNNQPSEISIILESKKEVRTFRASKVFRADLSSFFNRNDLDSTGFELLIDKRILNSGEYRVGVLVRTTKEQFSFTDKNVLK
jgi:hypothetical protein